MKRLFLIIAATLFIAGCSTTMIKEISPTLRYVEVKDSKGNVVDKYHEAYVEDNWYEAENKGGKWQLSAKGARDKEMAESSSSMDDKDGGGS